MNARPDLAPTAEQISNWCAKHQDGDEAAWRAIATLLRDGTVEAEYRPSGGGPGAVLELQWEDLTHAAERAMDRRKTAARAKPQDARLDARFGDAWTIHRVLQASAWKAGHCLSEAA